MPLKVVPRRDRTLNRSVKRARKKVLSRGQTLYSTGDSAHDVCLVKTGHLLQLSFSHRSQGRVVALAGPWEMTGEEALVPGSRRRTEARAGEDTEILVLDGAAVNRAFRSASRTLEAFLSAKEEDLELAQGLGGLRRPGGAPARLGILLRHLAARLGRDGEGGTILPIRLTHQVLADLCAAHRSTVTTILNDWIYQDILRESQGYLQILSPRALLLPPEP